MLAAIPKITRRPLAATAVLALSAAMVAISPSSAHAHTQSEAVEEACGSRFSIMDNGVREVKLLSGEVWGEVILTYNAESGYYCVVTRKIAFHGTHTRVIVGLFHDSEGVVFHDEPKVKHLLSLRLHGKGECTRYYAMIFSPEGDGAWGGMNPPEGHLCP